MGRDLQVHHTKLLNISFSLLNTLLYGVVNFIDHAGKIWDNVRCNDSQK